MIARSIETKLCEGILAMFQRDTDASAYWKRMFIGPWVGQDSSIVTPQLSITVPPNTIFSPGVSGVSDNAISIVITSFEQIVLEPFAAGGTSPICRLRHLQKVLAQGSFETYQGKNAFTLNGKVIDPDNAVNPDPTQRYLNNEMPGFRDLTYATLRDSTGKPAGQIFAFITSYVTRENIFTRIRA